jgi:hypothetical protein
MMSSKLTVIRSGVLFRGFDPWVVRGTPCISVHQLPGNRSNLMSLYNSPSPGPTVRSTGCRERTRGRIEKQELQADVIRENGRRERGERKRKEKVSQLHDCARVGGREDDQGTRGVRDACIPVSTEKPRLQTPPNLGEGV